MKIKDVFVTLQDTLALTQFPTRKFKFGIPAVPTSYDPQDHTPPGLFLDWFKGRFLWQAGMCGASNLKTGEADFNALIAMEQKDVPADYLPDLLRNEALAVFMCDLGETLIAKVIAGNADGSFTGFFASPMTLTHSFVKDEPTSLVNLLIRVSHIEGYGE